MKILHIGQLIGGLDIYIRNTIAYSDGKNIEFVIVHGKGDNSTSVLCGMNVVREYKVDLYRKLSLKNDLRCLFQVLRIARKEMPDLIHCHSAKGGFIGRLVGALTKTKTLYTPHAFSFLSTPSRTKQRIYLMLEKTVKFHSYLLACSESERRMGMDVVGYAKSHALLWHNSVPDASLKSSNTQITQIDADGNISEKQRTQRDNVKVANERFIAYIGRPCYQKNPFFLLDVIKKVSEKDASLKFYLLGVGYHSPDLLEMKQRIDTLGIGKQIRLVPWLNHEDCMEYVRQSMFYLTCSLYEGLPLSVIEAMSLGKAILASDVVGNRDCVRNGQNGYILPLDTTAFADKIIELSSDADKRDCFGNKSRRIFIEKFLIDNQITKLYDIYQGVEKRERMSQ